MSELDGETTKLEQDLPTLQDLPPSHAEGETLKVSRPLPEGETLKVSMTPLPEGETPRGGRRPPPPLEGETLQASRAPHGDETKKLPGAGLTSSRREDSPRSKTEAQLGTGARVAGRYRIERRLGTGGMGEVYLARDEARGRLVALKILHRHMADNLTMVNRFRREARIMRELSNPHAVTIHDFGQTDDGALYLAMEYLQGETLSALLERQGTLVPKRVLEIALDLLDVLADAHRLGIIHRDLKPQNVFLTKKASVADPVVKLLDFGIAKLQDQETAELTATGAIWGTPKYMSPEQARARPIDRRSDVYSLGVLMYKALTGVHPIDGASPSEIIYALMHATPDPPGKRRPDLNIPPELSRVVMRALEKEPEARYQSAVEMAEDLRAIASDTEAVQKPDEGRAASIALRVWIGLTLLMALASGLQFPLAARAPFPGFAVESGLLVSGVGDQHWPGIERGLEPYDIVVAVDGGAVRRGKDVLDHVRRLPVGTPVTYTIQRGDRTFDVAVPVSKLSWMALFQYYGASFIGGLLFLLVGAIAGWKNPVSRPVRALVAFTSALGLTLVTSIDFDFGGTFPWLWRLAVCATGATMLDLGLSFPELRRPLRRRPWLRGLLYVPAFVLFGVWQGFAHSPTIGIICTRVVTGGMFAGLLSLLGLLLHARIRGKTVSVRQSARFMLWAAAVSVLPSLAITVVPISLGIQNASLGALGWLAQIGLALFPAAVAYQVQRGQIFDVDVALHEILRALCAFALLFLVFTTASLPLAGLARLFDAAMGLQVALGALGGVAAVVAAAEPVSRWLRRFFERATELDGSFVLDDLAAATRSAESEDEVIELLFDSIRRCFEPRALRILERGQGGYYHERSMGSPESVALPPTMRPEDLERSMNVGGGATREPRHGDSANDIRRSVTKLGRWDAHAYLVLPLDSGEGAGAMNAALASVVVVGGRSDNKAYSSYDATLVAALIRIAALRMHALGERRKAERLQLLVRSFGADLRDAVEAGLDVALDAPARGIATALVLRFSGLDAAAESLPPKAFKGLVDELSAAAIAAAFEQGGTLHSVRGDELLFGFGALDAGRGAGELAALHAALAQLDRTPEVAEKHGWPAIRARVGAARGPVTVGTFGASFHADCLIMGGAVHEATELANEAQSGEILVGEEIAQMAEKSASEIRIERFARTGGAIFMRVVRNEA
ncbi:protein kinase domain-containing protein [Polyangium aurulentum]|uniref:protein kinase domain-containing protein n=1 Tax=Polyangium aurulentum TaxID=2567896 RepID=UPI0010AE651A|nr:protein kinase [Polyangium aurulentum]UQA55503.1 protein kinase [Polyangium aurulentum]